MKTLSILQKVAITAIIQALLVVTVTVNAQQATYRMTTDIPASITTPDVVETSIGTLRFFDGFPDEATVQKVYDNLDFQRGVQAFLTALPAASMFATREGYRTFGPDNQTILIAESFLDSRTLYLVANSETIYLTLWANTKDGPLVIDAPPDLLGFIDDFWCRYVIDIGRAGPDKGKGGKYLLLPPDYSGDLPDGYFIARSTTYGNFVWLRGFIHDGDLEATVENMKKYFRIYQLAQAANPPEMNFIDMSGQYFSVIPSNDASFFDDVNQVIQEEPLDAVNPETRGLLASVGIRKGSPFSPDPRMKGILADAAAVGNATARTILFNTRDQGAYLYKDSWWKMAFWDNDYNFSPGGVLDLDARTWVYYGGTGISPAMMVKMVGVGSQYAISEHDAAGQYLDGAKNYRLHLPPGIPARDFWSVIVYDPQTRSMLQTDQKFPGTGSQRKEIVVNPDNSVEVYFGPVAPPGRENNWIQTIPGKGWFIMFRLYGPLEPWFDKTWKPGEIELMITVNAQQAKYKMTTDIPASITTPDVVETSLGTLRFFDGFPDEATVKKVYDNLDFQRGVQVFLTALPAASALAFRTGCRTFGPDNQTVLITESLLDSRTLMLTGNTETIYNISWLDTHDGPLVIEMPAGTLGVIDDFWYRFVTDIGPLGPDKGNGGKFLLLPPGYSGDIPEGYFVLPSSTYGHYFFFRVFIESGNMETAIDYAKQNYRAYPLAMAANPPAMKFVNISGQYFNSIHSNSYLFYEEVDQVIQEEPLDAVDPEVRGLFAAVGIQKGKPFAPDERMKKILTDAAAVGNATARAIDYSTRDKEAYFYPNSEWKTFYIGNDYSFSPGGVLNLDARSYFYYMGTGSSPSWVEKMIGQLSQYVFTEHDAAGQYLDGGKSYHLHLPANIPAKRFWSLVVYDPQTRSMLQTDQQYPSISSLRKDIIINPDSSVDVYFGPEPPPGEESNWIQTTPGKGWFVILRLYGPLEPWFDKTWKPGEIEPVK